jgi:Flp pilus assembly protein TadG
MRIHPITSLLRNERGQAAIEFALVLPVLIAFLFLIVGFARVFNAYNDLNQMAADGARFAAVGNFPGESKLRETADTQATKTATIGDPTYSSGTCLVGATVNVTATADVSLLPFLPYIDSVHFSPQGKAAMRVERCPSP